VVVHALRCLVHVCLAILPISLVGIARPADAVEKVMLVPDDRASWRPSNLFAFLRPGHNFGERILRVETTPPGAILDLFYIRANFQKRYEQAESPAKVILPRRVEAGPRDAVMIRAFLEGYRQREVSLRVGSSQDQVRIELDPLPNTLVAASHSYFAGRASLAFLTRQPLQVRVQDREDGFSVILAETAKGPAVGDVLRGIQSPLVKRVEALQLGEDLLVQVTTAGPEAARDVDLRSRQTLDNLRDLHVYSVEMVPRDGGVVAVARARAALARIGPSDVTGCAAVFDTKLRASLEPAALSRALAPRGTFTDPYLRAAMRRLGEVSTGGRIAMIDGSSFVASSPLELAAAMSQPGDAGGYLALLRAFVRQLEPPELVASTLRGLVAPELAAASFEEALARAGEAEQQCMTR
jgi:hypothetical protein